MMARTSSSITVPSLVEIGRRYEGTKFDVISMCEIKGVRRGQTPKSMRDPCKVVICRDLGWVP